MRKAFNKVDDDMQIDSALFNPDELWKRPQVCVRVRVCPFGRVCVCVSVRYACSSPVSLRLDG